MTYVETTDPTAGLASSDREGQTGPPPFPQPTDADRKLVKLVKDRWRDGDNELMAARRNYWMNFAFYQGEQWCWWSTTRNQLQSYAATWSPLGEGRARLVRNRVEPNIVNVLARLLATPLAFQVPPSDAQDDIVAGANLGEDVLTAESHDSSWESFRRDELFDAIMGGTSAISVEWDGKGGDALEIDEEHNTVVGTGKARLREHAITEFCLEPGVTEFRHARWWICGLTMPPRDVQAQYGLKWCPKPDAASLLSPLQQKLQSDSPFTVSGPSGRNQTLVLCCYERPNPQTPKGQYTVVVNDRIAHTEPWPFPFKDRLNLIPFRQEQLPSRWQGFTYMVSAIKLQAQYNFYASMIAELMKKVGTPRMAAPDVLDEDMFNDDPDSIIFYPAGPGVSPPGYITPPSLPGWIATEINDVSDEIDEIMHVSQVSAGQSIGDRASGQALALLSEKDDSPLGLMGTEQATGWSQIAEMVLSLYAAHATETRTVTLRGDAGAPSTRQFTGKMLAGQTRVYIDPNTTQPVSKAAMQAFAKDLWDRQIITDPEVYARLAFLPPDFMGEVIDADVAAARYENALMSIGTVVVPQQFEDHAKHIAEHNRDRKSRGYRYQSDPIRKVKDLHVQAHEVMAAEQYGTQVGRAMESPGLAQLPQAGEPAGSQVPQDFAEMQAQLAQPAPNGGGPPQASGLGPPPETVPPVNPLPQAPAAGLANGVT